MGAETAIIESGISAITSLLNSLGLGSPGSGDQFAIGKSQFDSVHDLFGSALPDKRWQGFGSEAYANQNTEQQTRAQTMAAADREMSTILETEAGQVAETRRCLEKTRQSLSEEIPTALEMYEVSPKLSTSYQTEVVNAAMQVATTAMSKMEGDSARNALEIDAVTSKYNEMATEGSGLSSRSEEFLTPNGSEELLMPNGLQDERAPSVAPTGVDESPRDGSPPGSTKPELPQPSDEPKFLIDKIIGFMDKITTLSGQASQLSVDAQQHAAILNMMLGLLTELFAMLERLVQLFVSAAKAGAPVKAPVSETLSPKAPVGGTTLAGSVERDGAGTGTHGGERAPTDAKTVGGGQAQELPSGV